MATEKAKYRAESPPPRNRGSGKAKRTSAVWGLAEAARARPGVWLTVDMPKTQTSATGSIHMVRQNLGADAGRFEFTTRKKGEKLTAVYCRFNAGGKS